MIISKIRKQTLYWFSYALKLKINQFIFLDKSKMLHSTLFVKSTQQRLIYKVNF